MNQQQIKAQLIATLQAAINQLNSKDSHSIDTAIIVNNNINEVKSLLSELFKLPAVYP